MIVYSDSLNRQYAQFAIMPKVPLARDTSQGTVVTSLLKEKQYLVNMFCLRTVDPRP